MSKQYKVGDKYKVCDDGRWITGTITKIDAAGYHVQWSDGQQTIEVKPDPAGQGMRG